MGKSCENQAQSRCRDGDELNEDHSLKIRGEGVEGG